jgi:ABC-2 type transport system permease protein
MKDTADMPAGLVIPPAPRNFHGVNWTGATTLYLKEVKRFWKVGMQTLAAPVLNALLYLLIFSVGINRPAVNGIPYAVFIAPGLIMMSILNAAFANSSSSLMQAKMMGLAQDFLTAPLTPTEQVCAFALGAATRGVVVGLVTALAIWPLVHFSVAHWWAIFYFGLMASLMMGMIGMVAGLWAEKFDHLAAVTTFVVMPLTMLSGTFYTVQRLPEPFRSFSHYNPFFYTIAGFRYGTIGLIDGSVAIGVAVTGGMTLAMGAICWWLFQTGYRLKS